MARNEVCQVIRNGCVFDIAAGLNFSRDLVGYTVRPMPKRVEGDNANGVIELARQKIGDDGFEVRPLDLGFAVHAAQPTEAVDHEVYGLVGPIGHNRWRPVGLTH
jgi:hypothetical protein